MNKKSLIALCMIFISLNFVAAISITDVSSSPKEVAPGEIINVLIEIENIFDYDITNLNVKLDLLGTDVPFAPYQSSSEKFLEELEEGDKEDFKFKLITLPETSTGIYKIPVEISYNYENGSNILSNEKSELISVTVNSEPELKVSLDDSVVLIRGKEELVTLKIINSGLSDVKFLYVTINDATGLKFLNEREQYIGDVDSDDFDNVEYDVIVSENAPNSITLRVDLTYRDYTNKEFSETANLVLKTYSFKEAVKLGLAKKPKIFVPVIITLVIIGYIVYRIIRKKKLKKKRR